MKSSIYFLIALFVCLGLSSMANAVLIDRGGGLIYDSDYDITWLDANSGSMTWDQSNAWIEGLNTVSFLGHDSWRLPAIYPANGSSFNFSTSFDGSTDSGYNIIAGDLGHLFYSELKNLARYNTNGIEQSGHGLINTSFFNNLQNSSYWYGGSGYPFSSSTAPYFGFNDGGQSEGAALYNTFYALAIHDGDMGNPVPVPEPSTVLLVGTGLIGLVRFRKKFKK